MHKKVILISLISFSIFIEAGGSKQIKQCISNTISSQHSTKLVTSQASYNTIANSITSNNTTLNSDKKSNLTSNDKNFNNSSKTNYQLTNCVYKNKNVIIVYPKIVNLKDSYKEKKINELIKFDALNLLNLYKASDKEFNLDINYEIKWKSSNVLSIQYFGMVNFKGAAHPNNLFFTTNLNINKARKIRLNELVNIDKTLSTKFKSGKYINKFGVSAELNTAINMELDRLNNKDLIKMFKKTDTITSESYSYLTKDSLGLSIVVPHPVGDHAEFEIKYAELTNNIKFENEIWKDWINPR
jgi:hypothetical protein